MESTNIGRFIEAQENGRYEAALREIVNGRKRSHWIWYIFPQIHGLGSSRMSQIYSISSLTEAKAYLENDILRNRLREVSHALLSHSDHTAEEIFGDLDAMKVRSCMTLFDLVSPADIYHDVLETFYNGKRCEMTLCIVQKEHSVR